MSTLARNLRALLALLTSLVSVGCNRSDDFEGCVSTSDPAASSGARRDQCPSSKFPKEDYRSREVAGIVRRGEDVVPNAMVRVLPWEGFASSEKAHVAEAVTNAVGAFGGLWSAPLRYDMLVRFGPDATGRDDVVVYRGAAMRYIEPTIEGESGPFPRSWRARVDVRPDRTLPSDHELAFFANGDGVYGVTGDMATGLLLSVAAYSNPATIHAVEYVKSGGLATAIAYGEVDVTADAGAARFVTVHLDPIDAMASMKFDVAAPSGFSASDTVDVLIGYGRTSFAVLTRVPVGVATDVPIVPYAGYTYRAHATRPDGARADSGETSLDICPTRVPRRVEAGPGEPSTKDVCTSKTSIELPAPAVLVAPNSGEERASGGTLTASGTGVLEHVLVPESGGPRIRVIVRADDATLPDVQSLGATPAVGSYRWTVRSFPKFRYPEELAGIFARRYQPMSESEPRPIVLR